MKYRLMRAACAVAALGAAAAVAQTPAPKVTDVGPAPAEDRSSVGAVVIEGSPVRAQQGTVQRSLDNGSQRLARRQGRDPLKEMGGPPAPKLRAEPVDFFNRSADGPIMAK